jgi:hypothetical protein
MSVILTKGQSWDQVADMLTLDPSYGPAIANQNNMTGESITGQNYRIEIPDTWMKPEYAGKQISLQQAGSLNSIPMWVWAGMLAGTLFLIK